MLHKRSIFFLFLGFIGLVRPVQASQVLQPHIAYALNLVKNYGPEAYFGASFASGVAGYENYVGQAIGLSYIGLKTLPKAWSAGFSGGSCILINDLGRFVLIQMAANLAACVTSCCLGIRQEPTPVKPHNNANIAVVESAERQNPT